MFKSKQQGTLLGWIKTTSSTSSETAGKSSFNREKQLAEDKAAFDDIFSNAEEKCMEIDIRVSPPRKRKISSFVDDSQETGVFAETTKEAVKYWTFYPLLDSLILGQHKFLKGL